MCLKIGLGEDFGNGKCPDSSIWFFLFLFGGGQAGAQHRKVRTLYAQVRNQGRNRTCSSPKAPPSHLHAGFEQGYGLSCHVCPAFLPISGRLPMLSDRCFSLSVMALHYYLIFHASSAACDRAVLSIPCCLQNLSMKVERVGSPFSRQVAHVCFCSKSTC